MQFAAGPSVRQLVRRRVFMNLVIGFGVFLKKRRIASRELAAMFLVVV